MPTPKTTVPTEVIPYIFYQDVRAALDWLGRAFGFKEELFVDTPKGGKHAEMTLDGQRIMLGQGSVDLRMASSRHVGTSTQGVFVWIADADAHFRIAEGAGAEFVHSPMDLPYGRGYAARDLEGHPWFFTTPWVEES